MSVHPKPAPAGTAIPGLKNAVVEVRGLHWATSKGIVEHVLLQRPGVVAVDANAVAQTATVSFDPSVTSLEQITGWVRDCGYHCRGESVPDHICSPMNTAHEPSTLKGSAGTHAGH
ncbi:MAG: cation transporter, partial [Actinomycetes bacterium]